MPFIEPERRADVLNGAVDRMLPGDMCFLKYREMLAQWHEKPCWTRAHNIYIEHIIESRLKDSLVKMEYKMTFNERAAIDLAWQVFFAFHVLPYEARKREENGEVETE